MLVTQQSCCSKIPLKIKKMENIASIPNQTFINLIEYQFIFVCCREVFGMEKVTLS